MKYRACIKYLISYIDHCQTDTERDICLKDVELEEVLDCINNLNNDDNVKEVAITISGVKEDDDKNEI